MSDINPSGVYESERLNQASAHDTGMYDPTVHDNQIVAMYETDAQARAAYDVLVNAGVPAGAIQVVARESNTGALGGVNAEDRDSGVWGAIRSLFVPDEDRTAYSHAVGRGHAMLVIVPQGSIDRQHLVQMIESTDPIDFDAKLEQWRQAGYDTSTAHPDYLGSTSAVTAGAVTTPAVQTETVGTRAVGTGADDTLKLVREELRVGKREVQTGGMRLRSYVVERPVSEQVNLHEERVEVVRRPVDRAATVGDIGAFEERTIEARAMVEEAVVNKEARVVEEVGLNKTATDRTETVKDTVRETKVEVENLGGGLPKTQAATGGAGTSGANAPRR